MLGVVLLVLALVMANPAMATTYYLDDAGSDAANGLTTGTPWKTWSKAFTSASYSGGSPCGHTLIVMDGTYTKATHGTPNLDGLVCTAGNNFVIQAQTARQAWVQGDGTTHSFLIRNSAYITLDGLHISGADAGSCNPSCGSTGTVLYLGADDFLTVRNLILNHPNRYDNAHQVEMVAVRDSLVENLELYEFHRHGIAVEVGESKNYTPNRNVIRNIYCHNRYGPLPDGYPNGNGAAVSADTCVSMYPTNNTIVENIVAEGNMTVIDIQAVSLGANNNSLYNIVNYGGLGMNFRSREPGDAANVPTSNHVTNFVYVWVSGQSSATGYAFYTFSGLDTICDHCTVFNNDARYGYVAAMNGSFPGTHPYGQYIRNSQSNHSGYGFYFSSDVTVDNQWGVTNSNAFTNSIAAKEPPSSGNYVNVTTIDPQMGTCYLWVPDASPMKGAGTGGSDIGANILYLYDHGVQIATPIWDTSTGALTFCGATVTGLNDSGGNSCNNVHQRLNVNLNGCAFPAGYGSSSPPPGVSTDSPLHLGRGSKGRAGML